MRFTINVCRRRLCRHRRRLVCRRRHLWMSVHLNALNSKDGYDSNYRDDYSLKPFGHVYNRP